TLLNLAVCHEGQGKTASAWAEYTSVANQARREGRTRREVYAKERIEVLKPLLSHVTIKIQAPVPQMTIKVDGKPFEAAMADTPLPMDPGRHSVEAVAPGKRKWAKVVDVVGNAQALVVEIPMLADDEAAVAPTPGPAPAPGPETPKPPAGDQGPDQPAEEGGIPMLAWVGFGVGGAGLVVGAVTGIMTLGKAGDIKEACGDDTCPPDQEEDLDSATTLANVSNVGFAVAGVGAAVGLIALFTMGGDEEPEPAAEAWVRPLIGVGSLGIEGRF
ncbi:MAG: hypothetical protein JRI68_30055, partial [Deltaproteobacteria bacterium]|nr:hypothetical protein [Deltaproteobacteria bacterium]